ncbi:MAG: hypothetical protein HYV27_25210 [Candidatus Hydrogenedentes bacterium]|nr:hypothetical protein [Candidatus Hydrogenedentota bacterium]
MIAVPPTGTDLTSVAKLAQYVGSPEHKRAPSFAGQLAPRADASICGKKFLGRQEELTEAIRENIARGNIGAQWEGQFPRYVWCKIEGEDYEARLVNRDKGEYKGYRLEPGTGPKGV